MLILLKQFLLFHVELLLILIVHIFVVLHLHRIIQSVVAVVEVVIRWWCVHNHILEGHMLILASISLLVSLEASCILFVTFISLLKLFMVIIELSCGPRYLTSS
jgi:hypothetical protein